MAYTPASSNYPTAKDTYTAPIASDVTGVIDIAGWYGFLKSAIDQIQSKVGISSSDDTASIDYKLTNASSSNPGHRHTLAHSASDITASASELNQLDGVTVGGNTSGDIVTTDDTETLTNKSISGSANTIENLLHGTQVDNPSSGVHGVTGSVVGTSDQQTLTNKTLTTPRIGTSLNDTNGNEVVRTPATTSAVNDITVTNAISTEHPQISATGDDDNINLELRGKGTGKVDVGANFQTPQTYTPDAAATQDLDLSTGNEHRVTMPAGNITLTVSNETNGQRFIVSITQDSGGSRTVAWFDTNKWAGGSAPTLTTTGNKRDTFGFIVTGTDTYDGFIIGQSV